MLECIYWWERVGVAFGGINSLFQPAELLHRDPAKRISAADLIHSDIFRGTQKSQRPKFPNPQIPKFPNSQIPKFQNSKIPKFNIRN
jgi:hypothetical protein